MKKETLPTLVYKTKSDSQKFGGHWFRGKNCNFIPSKKHLNISIFKRGFKGENYSLAIYEKFFSKKLFNKIQSFRTKNFLKTINE